MSYIGSPPSTQSFAPGTDTFNGDGTTVAFTLSRNVATVNDILVVVNNVEQQPTAYSVSVSTLTFSAAPSSGTANIYVRYLSTNLQTIAPQQGSVYPSSLSTPNALYWDTSGNVGVGTTSPDNIFHVAKASTSTSVGSSTSTVKIQNTQSSALGETSGVEFFNRNVSGSAKLAGVYGVYENYNVTGYAGALAFATESSGATNVTERMRIDSSGNVGIGIISTNGYWGSTNTDAKVNIAYSSSGTTFDTAIKGLVLQNTNTTTSNTTSLIFGSQNTGGTGIAQAAIYSINGTRGGAFNSGQLGFSYANSSGVLTEAMRIDSTGGVRIKTTTNIFNSAVNEALTVDNGTNGAACTFSTNASGGFPVVYMRHQLAGSQNQIIFYSSAGIAGSITSNGLTAAYNSASDYRLKENVQPMVGALNKVAQLKPCTYSWKHDGSDGQGFIAHELQVVVPDCVTGEKDAVDADGNPNYQGVDTSYLVATLTAAIQEQQAMIEELKTKVAALEAR
jgi:hypothetical protein